MLLSGAEADRYAMPCGKRHSVKYAAVRSEDQGEAGDHASYLRRNADRLRLPVPADIGEESFSFPGIRFTVTALRRIIPDSRSGNEQVGFRLLRADRFHDGPCRSDTAVINFPAVFRRPAPVERSACQVDHRIARRQCLRQSLPFLRDEKFPAYRYDFVPPFLEKFL